MPLFIHVKSYSEDTGCLATYWCAENDLGMAIGLALQDASQQFPDEAATPDEASMDHGTGKPPDHFIQTDVQGLYVAPERNCWDLSAENTPDFWFPLGVIPTQEEETLWDVDEISEAYQRGASENHHWLELIVDQRNLRSIFTELFKSLPSADGPEICLLDHWESSSGQTEVYLCNLEGNSILQFLEANWHDLIHNGGVEVAVYCRAERCTFRVTDHKTLAFYSDTSDWIDYFEKEAMRLGFQTAEPFRSIEWECHHFHYAPTDARSRIDMKKHLAAEGFVRVDE